MFAPKMFGVCLRYAKDRTEAEDSLQEGFVKVFSNIGGFRHEGSFEGWIRRIMVNTSLKKYRKQYHLHPVDDMTVFDSVELPDEILAKIGADELLALVQELPPRYRMVFNLFVMEGLNHNEISEAMNITTGTSKSNLARAREILKKKVLGLYGEMKSNASYSAS